jgi:phosphohistidine swiveling domain-containing protein
MPDLIVSLSDPHKLDSLLVGGKAVNIAVLVNAGFPVPRAFCVTTAAYQRQVKEMALSQDLLTFIADPAQRPSEPAESLRERFLAAPVAPDVERGIRAAYRGLGEDVRVAVRSSATAEDSPTASFAGQHDSFLGVHGEHALLEAVRKCWASLWTERAIQYRNVQKVPHASVALAVVVQQMIPADVAGVMFTVNPVTGSREELTISASYGLGEAVVSGLVTPDTYVVAKRAMTISRVSVGTKEQKVVQQDHGTMAVPVTTGEQRRQCLGDSMILEVARVGIAVERHYGRPQDIEWAVADHRVHLLQSRPVTSQGTAPTHAVELPGPEEKAYGWIYLGRLPRIARRPFVAMARDHFPQPLRPFDIYTTLVPALAGARRVAGELGIRLPVEVARPHPSGLVLFNPPVPPIIRTLSRVPTAWRELNAWARYDPLREWQDVDEPYLRALTPSAAADTMSPGELLASIQRLQEVITELMYRRFRKYMAAGAAANRRLNSLLRKTARHDADETKRRLMLNTGHKTAAINQAAKALANVAADNPAVRHILTGRPYNAKYTSLMADPRCREFADGFRQFIADYGSRTALTMEPQPSYPAWRDEPDQVLSLIGFMITHPALLSDSQPDEENTYREVRTEMVRRLQGDPARLGAFERAVDVARGFVIAREASLYFLEEIVGLLRIRADLLGARLADEGQLRLARHIYYLAPDEVEDAVSNKGGSAVGDLAQRRQVAWEEMREAWSRTSAAAGDSRRSLRGTAVSGGLAVGAARIVRAANDFERLRPGDILVCPSTTPAWTPLFGIAAAVVADAGGVLSHAAIVAREYGIPAVMGCSDATRTLVDGEWIEVNGTRGTVRRLSPSARAT